MADKFGREAFFDLVNLLIISIAWCCSLRRVRQRGKAKVLIVSGLEDVYIPRNITSSECTTFP